MNRVAVEIALQAIAGALGEFSSDKGKAYLEAIRSALGEIEDGLGLRPESIVVTLRTEYGPVSFEFAFGGPRD